MRQIQSARRFFLLTQSLTIRAPCAYDFRRLCPLGEDRGTPSRVQRATTDKTTLAIRTRRRAA